MIMLVFFKAKSIRSKHLELGERVLLLRVGELPLKLYILNYIKRNLTV